MPAAASTMFPRQIWRDSAMALAGDSQALALSLKAVELGWLEAEPEQARQQFGGGSH